MTEPPAAPRDDLRVDELIAQLADVEVTREELQVVEETLRSQQQDAERLLARFEAEHRWRSRLSALLPVGLCLTDGNGKLVDANPALAATLRVGLHRLTGKPLAVYLAPADTADFRHQLRALASGERPEHRGAVTLRPRGGAPAEAELFGFPETVDHDPATARVQWVLVPRRATGGEPGLLPAHSEKLAEALAQLSALPVATVDRHQLLGRMATLVGGAVPAASWVSVTVGPPGSPDGVGSDSAQAQAFDGLQLRAEEGPAFDAHDTGQVVLSPDIGADERWPVLAKLADRGEVRSTLVLPARTDGNSTALVSLYADRRHAFGPSDRRIAELVVAAVAGVLQMVAERESLHELTGHLHRALDSRAVIDQAKGMVMLQLDVDAEEAFRRLVALSSRLNVKVRDLAQLIVAGDRDSVLGALRG